MEGQAKLQKALNEFRRDMAVYIDLIQFNARLRREKFEALVGEGFSKEEALAICIGTKITE